MATSLPEPSLKKPKHGPVQAFIDQVNAEYEKVHVAYEEQFWGCKMGLRESGSFSTERLSSTKAEMEAWLRSPENKTTVDALLESGEATAEQQKVLDCFKRTFSCYQMSDQDAVMLRAECTKIEDTLNASRNGLSLGYADPSSNEFVEKSSVGLRTVVKTHDDEATRKAAWEGLRALGPFVCANGFCSMIKLRNAMARKLGYADFYDYKVTQAEGFGKTQLFSILDTLLEGSNGLLAKARAELAADKGTAALDGWNIGYMMAGDVEKQLDPYFPFEHAVEQWGRCFAKLGIDYQGATMTLDLLDRKGKYSNGFCHWPQPAWIKSDGSWQPSTTNFTSLADPAAVGSGKTALTTLMHEAGHAAHFANIKQGSPLFSQERAPTSVAYAENQSMFLDSLCGDAAWRARYARNRAGEPLPWELHEAELRSTFPYRVFALRAMLSVPYFEKALYELPDDRITADEIQALANRVEKDIQGGLAARPLLSVPHIISDEASCYYHGYVLAEMSVYQTRKHFQDTLKVPIVDNPLVGATLTESYWKPGNSTPFLALVENLTGAPLTGVAWLEDLAEPIEAVVASERAEYAEAIKAMAADGPASVAEGGVALSMRMIIKDGDTLIADSEQNGGFIPACKVFADHIAKRFQRSSS